MKYLKSTCLLKYLTLRLCSCSKKLRETFGRLWIKAFLQILINIRSPMRAQDPMTEEQTGHRRNTSWLKITERSMKLESNESHLSEVWGWRKLKHIEWNIWSFLWLFTSVPPLVLELLKPYKTRKYEMVAWSTEYYYLILFSITNYHLITALKHCL